MTSTNGVRSAKASAVDRADSRGSGFGSVVTAARTPPLAAAVGVLTAGA
jgi:hypothetical protein